MLGSIGGGTSDPGPASGKDPRGPILVPFHAANELDDDDISIFDVENIILTGEIIQRQRDSQSRERKYVVRGGTLAGEAAACVVKIGPTGEVVLITAWVE